MKNYTDITVLLDRSGSMQSIKAPMEEAFKEFLVGHKTVPSTRLTLIQFDSYPEGYEVVYTARPIGDIAGFTLEPRGMTPLVDSLCKAIDDTGARLAAMKESERPNSVLFIIITDGHENASYIFTRANVRERIERQNKQYNWQFVYLGANQDAYEEARSYGISLDSTMNFAATKHGTQAGMRGVTLNTVSYAGAAAASNVDPSLLGFSQEQQDEALDKKAGKKNAKTQ